MPFRPLLLLLLFSVASRASLMPPETLRAAITSSTTDDVGSGYCGRGVWSVLSSIGYGTGLHSGDGQDWEGILRQGGWTPVPCITPRLAPPGSVLVYRGNMQTFGQKTIETHGAQYGHVELVAQLGTRKIYVSDAPRINPGGTVLANFTRRAWIPPHSQRPDSASVINEQIACLLETRLSQAKKSFAGSKTQLVLR